MDILVSSQVLLHMQEVRGREGRGVGDNGLRQRGDWGEDEGEREDVGPARTSLLLPLRERRPGEPLQASGGLHLPHWTQGGVGAELHDQDRNLHLHQTSKWRCGFDWLTPRGRKIYTGKKNNEKTSNTWFNRMIRIDYLKDKC